MKILSDAESAGIKILVVILVAALIALAFWKFDNNKYTVLPVDQGWSDTLIIHDTITVHDTIVDVHPITRTVHDTIYITD